MPVSSRFVVSWLLALASGGWAATPGPAPAASRPALPQADLMFLTRAAETGQAEVEAGKLAVTKGVNTQVKGFAQQMVDEHTKVAAALAKLAAAKGVQVPTAASLAQHAHIKLLASSDGGAFDRRYAASMGVKAHEDSVRLFMKAAKEVADPDIKAFAVKTLPTLQNHLKMAIELKGVVDKEGNVKAPHDRKL